MTHIVELGTISSRGQVAIPAEARRKLDLKEGERILFVVEGDAIIMKKADTKKTWEEVTKPLREAARHAEFKELDVEGIVHRFRASRKR